MGISDWKSLTDFYRVLFDAFTQIVPATIVPAFKTRVVIFTFAPRGAIINANYDVFWKKKCFRVQSDTVGIFKQSACLLQRCASVDANIIMAQTTSKVS